MGYACPVPRIGSSGGDIVKKIRFWGATLVLLAILARPESAVAGAQRAMRLWYSGVAPALFPFLALMPALTGDQACAAYNAALSRVMMPLFRLPGAAAPALVIGMLSGSPGGAIAVRRVASETGMGQRDAQKLAMVLSGVSPAFLVLGVGQGMYGSAALGVRLALIQGAIQIALLLILRGYSGGETVRTWEQSHNSNPIFSAVETVLSICGYMVFFGTIGCVAADLAGAVFGTGLLLVADLPSGLAMLAAWEIPGKMLIQGAAIGFAGLCIASQNLDAMRPLGVNWREYFSVRGVVAGCMAVCSGLFLPVAERGAESFASGSGRAFAVSLLAALLASLPGLIYLTKSLYLNKGGRGT